ncbi:MAG TPA: ComEC/Rec2 family competence protein, partial [Aggregatilineaceae bacterium]|nr:ComEC/Rec2 family competence protein [Aggregatilineaceae bacterium]
MTLVYLVVAWVAGVLVASRAAGSVSLWLAIAGASALAGVLLRASRRDRRALACLCLFALGAARLDLAQRPLAADHIARRIGDGRLVISGLVDSLPDPRATYVNLRVSVDSARQGATAEPASGRVLVQAPLSGRYRYGDRVQITGALTLPPAYDDFSYRDYLARRGIHALLRAESVEVVGRGGRPWLRAIYALRERSAAIIEEVLPSPQAPVLAGILLGDESGIPKDVREAFNRTGASHVIAISGANIAVLLRALMGLLTPLAGKDRAALLASVGVAVYAVLVGGDPGVLRAVFMGVLALVASRTGRRAHGLTSLAFAVWVLSAYDPEVLWDIGFQLSVAATLGLVLFTDDLTALFGRVLGRVFPAATAQRLLGWLSEPLVVSVAAQIATTPLIVYAFGRLSIASLLTNLLIVPVQPYIMIAGWLALVAGHASIALGEVLAWGVWLPLTYMLRVIETLARFSWSSAEVRLSAGAVWLIYVGLLLWGVSRTMHPGDRAALWAKVRAAIPAYAAGGAGLIVALLVWQAALRQPDGRLHVWFLDVGDGSAALIETPRGAQVLIGSGKSPVRLQAA